MFSKMKDLYKMQSQAKQIKKELSAIHIQADVDWVIVTMTWEMELISIEIPDEMMWVENKNKLSKAIIEATKKAKKKAEEVSAEKMKAVMWWMFPWMWG